MCTRNNTGTVAIYVKIFLLIFAFQNILNLVDIVSKTRFEAEPEPVYEFFFTCFLSLSLLFKVDWIDDLISELVVHQDLALHHKGAPMLPDYTRKNYAHFNIFYVNFAHLVFKSIKRTWNPEARSPTLLSFYFIRSFKIFFIDEHRHYCVTVQISS